MKEYLRHLCCVSLAWVALTGTALAGPGVIPTEPLWLNLPQDNFLFSIDDSMSMTMGGYSYAWDYDEQSFGDPAESPRFLYTTDSLRAARNGGQITGAQFNKGNKRTLFRFSAPPNPTSTPTDWQTPDKGIPWTRHYAFMRSPSYSSVYYDPAVTYLPWPSYGGFTWATDFTNTPVHPGYDAAFNPHVDLSQPVTLEPSRLAQGMACDNDCPSGFRNPPACSDTCPGTTSFTTRIDEWYMPTDTGSFEVPESLVTGTPSGEGYCSLSSGSYSCDCANWDSNAAVAPLLYRAWEDDPFQFSTAGGIIFDEFALGPDGRCLTRHRPTTAAEKANFANWFSYNRTRLLTTKGAVARAIQGREFNAGAFTFTFDDVEWGSNFFDWTTDQEGSPSQLLDFIYEIPTFTRITPLRSSLYHGSREFRESSGPDALIQFECQRNFLFQFTDGGNTRALGGDGTPGSSVGNVDGSAPPPIGPDPGSDLQADVALDAYLTNPRPDICTGSACSVPVPEECNLPTPPPFLDCKSELHVNTSIVTLGGRGEWFNELGPAGILLDSVEAAYAPGNAPTWFDLPQNGNNPDPSKPMTQADDAYHAAINGRGSINNATEVSDLVESFANALDSAAASAGSFAGVAANTRRVTSDTLLFSTSVQTQVWRSQLRAFKFDPATTSTSGVAWEAGALLDAIPDSAISDRVVLTKGLPFQWAEIESSLDLAIQALETDLLVGGVGPAGAAARVEYLRGDRTNEGFLPGEFRVRQSRLADIVGSQPLVVGGASSRWPNQDPFGAPSERFSTFRDNQGSRRPVLYVGGNGGALHGFVADNSVDGGQEILAYIPAALASTQPTKGLHYLTDQFYDHRFYVDGSPVAADVYIDGPGTSPGDSAWRTLLVGTLGAGGRGVFALDVTEPERFAEVAANTNCLAGAGCASADEISLWEFSDSDDSRLGFTIGTPAVGILPDGDWYVVLGNGYNSNAASPAQASLIVLNIERGLDGWAVGDYFVLNAPSFDGTENNGLASPTLVDTDGDFVFDRAYAGDIQGRMHAFDLSDTNPTAWAYDYTVYEPEADTNKPITAAPAVVENPQEVTNASNAPNLLVMFGTGQYLAEGDNNQTACPEGVGTASACVQTFNIVWDNQQSESSPAARTLSDLAPVDIDTEASGERVIASSPVQFSDSGSVFGCYVSLGAGEPLSTPQQGERVVTAPARFGDVVLFNTTIPATSACEIGGTGFQMFMNYATCTLDDPFVDINGDQEVDASDVVNGKPAAGIAVDGLVSSPEIVGNVTVTTDTSDGTPAGLLLNTAPFTGRISWEELLR